MVGYDTVQQWQEGALNALLFHGLLRTAPAAHTLECRGCEEHCFSDVVVRTSEGKARAHIVCEVPERQAEMGLVSVPLERLQQWQSSPTMVARFIAGVLGLDAELATAKNAALRLGMLKGPHGRRWVSLLVETLSLEVGQHSIPVTELLFVDDGSVVLDEPRIRGLLSLQAESTSKPYMPSTDKRESRKQNTEAMRQDWRDAHKQLRCEHPGQSNRWYAIRIAKLPAAQGRDAETIRRQL
tara:strand:- start:3451 stop:4170 length:720 start_codon:yes stop_codon:yes gene_type:complete